MTKAICSENPIPKSSNCLMRYSAKYRLVELTEILGPYDETLNNKNAGELAEWAEQVYEWLRGNTSSEVLTRTSDGLYFELHGLFNKTPRYNY